MVDENSLSVSLEEFGLSKYESRAYVSLLTKGSISASELSYYSEIPRTKVYPVLLKLEKKKLVILSKSKPIICTPIAPEDAFDDIVHEQINKVNAMNSLVSNLKEVNEASKKSRGSEEKRYFHVSANNVLNQLRTMIEGSKGSIQIMADQWGMGLLAECKDQFLSVLRRELDVKLIIPSTQIGSESFKIIPNEVKIRISDITQNCFIFDQTELLIIDSDNGKGATFSSTDILGANQTKLFAQVWKSGIKVNSMFDMTKAEAQEIYKIIKLVNEGALGHLLTSTISTKDSQTEIIKMLESNGVNIKEKTLDDVLEIMEVALEIMCSGKVTFDTKNKNISVESKMNSGHSLPWVMILDEYLRSNGYKTRLVYQSQQQKGEKTHIKISS